MLRSGVRFDRVRLLVIIHRKRAQCILRRRVADLAREIAALLRLRPQVRGISLHDGINLGQNCWLLR